MSEAGAYDSEEPKIIRNPGASWIIGFCVAAAIVVVFWWAAAVNNRVNQPWSPSTGAKGNVLFGGGWPAEGQVGTRTTGSPSTGGLPRSTVGPPEGSAPSGRGTVPTPPGPGNNALPATPEGGTASGTTRP